MEKRVIFNSKEIREDFFNESLKLLNFKTWNELADFLKIRKNLLIRYRNGKLTLPENFYLILSNNLNTKKRNYFSNQISFLDNNWGRIKAGKITYSRHKFLFDIGRKKAILSSQKRVSKFNIHTPLDKDLAYFIGLFVGDGFTNKYGRYYLIQFIGHISEKEFYETKIINYCNHAFGISPIIKKDKIGNYIRINIYSFGLFKLLTERFKIPAGSKSRIVMIPDEILNSDVDITKSFIRGLYDAEGCVFLDKRANYLRPYPRIDLHMCNLNLLKQVYKILDKIGIKCSLVDLKGNFRVLIYGKEQVGKFVKEIGFSNSKHLEKIKGLIV